MIILGWDHNATYSEIELVTRLSREFSQVGGLLNPLKRKVEAVTESKIEVVDFKGRLVAFDVAVLSRLFGDEEQKIERFLETYSVDLGEVVDGIEAISRGAELRGGSPNCLLQRTGIPGVYRMLSDYDDEGDEKELMALDGTEVVGDAALATWLAVFAADQGGIKGYVSFPRGSSPS